MLSPDTIKTLFLGGCGAALGMLAYLLIGDALLLILGVLMLALMYVIYRQG